VVSFTPPPLYPQRKIRSYPLDSGLGRPQSRSERDEEKNFPLNTNSTFRKDQPAHIKYDNHALNVLSILHVTEPLKQLSVEISYCVQNYITLTFLLLFYNETYGRILEAFIILSSP
jgi:hypothetical protein